MVSLAQSKPWLAEGISRATWFRRQKGPDGPDGRTKQAKAIRVTVPVIDKAMPRNAIKKASDSEIASIRPKIAAIGPGAVFTKTAGRLDVIPVAAFKVRQKAAPTPRNAPQPQRHAALSPIPPTPRLSPPTPSRALTVAGPTPLRGEVISPPRSMIADGGTPPRRYAKDASVAEATALIRAYASEQARINAETARRLDALERHVMTEERNKATKAAGAAKWAKRRDCFSICYGLNLCKSSRRGGLSRRGPDAESQRPCTVAFWN